MDRIYLDHAATTPVGEEVLAAVVATLRDVSGNPSSLHASGRRARKALEEAREKVAAVVGVRPRQVTFTSGATEADALALRGLAGRAGGLVTSRLEHAAVLRTAESLAAEGRRVVYVAHGPGGEVTADAVEAAMDAAGPEPLVALMLVNNETGVLLETPSVGSVVSARCGTFFSDAVQAAGTEDLRLSALGVDAIALSGHKVGGPKGVGVLARREGVPVEPSLVGGTQEGGVRPGTQAVASIVGMAVALELAEARRVETRARVEALRDRLEALLTSIPGVRPNGAHLARGPKHSNVTVAGVDGETLLVSLDDLGVEVSAGSACAAGSLEPSHVLLALGLGREEAKASVRFSLGPTTTESEVAEAARRFRVAVERCRAVAA